MFKENALMIKIKIKGVVLIILAIVLIGAMIASNVILNKYKTEITLAFTGGGQQAVTNTEERDNALELGGELVEDILADSAVLLKNENGSLPLAKDTKLNLFGWNATDSGFLVTGGGSGGVNINANLKVTLTDALTDAGVAYNQNLIAAYEAFNNSYDADQSGGIASGAEAELLNPGEDFYTDELMTQAREYSDTAVVVISRFQKENGFTWFTTQEQGKWTGNKWSSADHTRHYLETSVEEDAMLDKVYSYFGDGNVIVLLNLCNVMECGFIDSPEIDSALLIGTTGQSGANAIPDLLYGDISPSGRTADTFAYEVESAPSWANASYTSNPGGKRTLPSEMQRYVNNLLYSEGIYVGYRWYETAFADKVKINANGKVFDYSTEEGYRKVVQYPFGYGLSYSEFEWELVSAPEDGTALTEGGTYEVQVRVTNTGTVEAKDVVQLYYTPPYSKGGIEKSAVNLLAYAKTASLKPANMTEDGIAESQVVTLSFSAYDLAAYDCYDENENNITGYELDVGDYELRLMINAHEAAVMDDNSFTLNVRGSDSNDSVLFLLDPVTVELVENRFTGETAYAGLPADGSTVHDSVSYMSRADFAGTFPVSRHEPPKDTNAIRDASTFVYNGYGNVRTPDYDEVNDGMYLVMREDGSRPGQADLDGQSGATLAYNEDLMRKLLASDNAPEWDLLLSQISESDTESLIRNGGFQTQRVTALGMPRVGDSDGPTGFSSIFDSSNEQLSVAFPSASIIASSWNPQNAYSVGRMQGLVGRSRSIGGWYAPCVNIHRSPFGSRNFESYSEDPLITGTMAAEIIRGAKHNGMRCFLKHFALDDCGDNPWDMNLWATEQTMREIYLKPFEIGVKEGGANAMMSSFNRIGAVWSGSNHALLTDILRTEWGFKGVVITDANNGYMHMDRGVRAGNNLWLAGGSNPSSINMSDAALAYAARLSVKGIVYNFADTYIAAKDFAEFGDPDDPYKVNIDKVITTETPSSPLFIFLWVLLNVILIAGVALCVLFVILSAVRRKKDKQPE